MAKKGYIPQERIETIKNATYNQIVGMLNTGNLDVKELRRAYSQLRDIAEKRIKRVSTEEVTKEFGTVDVYDENGVYFRKIKNISTTSELVRELADMTRFLRSKRSTVKGLRKQREQTIWKAEKLGFDVNERNYLDFIKFMRWFKSSEYAKLYDSDSPEVQEVFNSGATTEADWKELFKAYAAAERKAAPVVDIK